MIEEAHEPEPESQDVGKELGDEVECEVPQVQEVQLPEEDFKETISFKNSYGELSLATRTLPAGQLAGLFLELKKTLWPESNAKEREYIG